MVVGLGNPGSRYARTRHNIGFMVVDRFVGRCPSQAWKGKFSGDFADVVFEEQRVGLLKPGAYMNRSGVAVAEAMNFYKLAPENLLVVTDDMALMVGRLRLRRSGSAGGHNGLASVVEHLGTEDFARLRIGIGQSTLSDSVDYVLGRFDEQESSVMDEAVSRAVEVIGCWLVRGIEAAMNKFNAPQSCPENSDDG